MGVAERIFNFAIVPVAVCLLAARDISLLFHSDVAVGIDGYYYVLQVASLLGSGHLYFPTNTPVLIYVLSVISFFFNDPAFGIKVGACVFDLLLAIGIGSVVFTLTKKVSLGGLGLLIIVYSPLHLYFFSEFLSNLGALTFLVWAAFGLIRFVKTQKAGWIVFAGALGLAAGFSHRSAIWLIAVFAVLGIFTYFWVYSAEKLKYRLWGSIVILLAVAVPIVLASQNVFPLPDEISREIVRLPANPFRLVVLPDGLILLTVAVVTIAAFFIRPVVFKNNIVLATVLLSTVVWTLLFALNPFLNHQAGITGTVARLDLLIYLSTGLALPLMFSLLYDSMKKLTLTSAALCASLLWIAWLVPLPLGLRPDYLRDRERLFAELPALRAQICEHPTIIARHGDQFLVTWRLGVPSQKVPPASEGIECSYWLFHQPKTNHRILFHSPVESSGGDLELVADAEMRTVFPSLPPEQQRQVILENGHLRSLVNPSAR